MDTILHIGTDKTGSTAIQMALFYNRDWFLQRSVYVPNTGLGIDNGHAVLLQNLNSKRLAELANELKAAKASGYRTCIISWEGMCRYSPKQIKTLSQALPQRSVQVLVYLREQAEVIQSAHLQWVQMNAKAIEVSSLAQPESLFQKARQKLFLHQPKRNYHRLLKRWLNHYPNIHIRARPFHPEQLKNSDVVSDFVDQLGLAPDDGFVTDARTTNPSMDLETTLMLQTWRMQQLPQQEIDARLDIAMLMAANEPKSTRYFFEAGEVETIRRHYRTSNYAVSQLGNVTSPQPLFTLSDCWRQERVANILNRAKEREKAVVLAAQIPTLWNDCAGDSLTDEIALTDGWSTPETWGVWSNAKTSELIFRLPSQVFHPLSPGVDIQLAGRYYGQNNATDVAVNGVDYGKMDLSKLSTKIRVAAEQLDPSRHVNVVLRHQHTASPHQIEGNGDFRKIAFALCALSYKPVKHP